MVATLARRLAAPSATENRSQKPGPEATTRGQDQGPGPGARSRSPQLSIVIPTEASLRAKWRDLGPDEAVLHLHTREPIAAALYRHDEQPGTAHRPAQGEGNSWLHESLQHRSPRLGRERRQRQRCSGARAAAQELAPREEG